MNDFTRGSEWGKWDLHAHTPLDSNWKSKPILTSVAQKRKFARDYIVFAKSENLSLISIADHNFCNNISDLLIPYIQEEAKKEGIVVLPGFEITVKDGSGIHLLVIFPENTPVELIKSIIDQCFDAGTILIPKNNVPVSTKSINEVKEIIAAADTESVFIFAHVDRENGALDGGTITGTRRVQEWHNKNVNISQLSQAPDSYPKDSFMNQIINKTNSHYQRDMSYIVSSDCRSISRENNDEGRTFLGQKAVWVKANPTFNGLKQIIYEPSERIRIQEKNPSFDYSKPYFESIEITEETPIFENWENQTFFQKISLPLNKNLVAIIGGRGSGKSMLINYIGSIFGFDEKSPSDDIFSRSKNVKIAYAKNNQETPDIESFSGDKDNVLEYIFIRQSELKEFSDKKEIGKHIKRLLKLDDLYFSEELDQKINEILQSIRDLNVWFEAQDENGDPINNKEFIERYRSQNESLLKSIKTKNNRSKLEQYTKNIDRIRYLEQLRQKLIELKNNFSKIEAEENNLISVVNNLLTKEDGLANIPDLNMSDQISKIDSNLSVLLQEIESKQDENNKIKKDFVDSGYTGDLSSLLENADKYQTNINKSDAKLERIKKQSELLAELIKARELLSKDIFDEYNNQKTAIDKAWENVLEGKDEKQKQLTKEILLQEDKIQVKGEIFFDKEKFYNKLISLYADKRCLKDEAAAISELIITDLDSYISFLKNRLAAYIPGGEKSYLFKQNIENLFFNLQERKEYLYTSPKITYRGRPLERTSVGQRGTVYLCLKLATDAFSKPIIFDQPEDDLDNEFINEELKDIFKKLKIYRQIIIVTHNANLVVNADAEQVIVATNLNEKLNYESGSLENKKIVDRACKILEGGEEAFLQRESKYGITKN